MRKPPSPPPERFDREVALLYFAHRNMAAVADGPLVRLGMGRAHHRALFFVGRRPGMAVKELQTILSITYQGLHRVLSDLMAAELLEQEPDSSDKRRRHLILTPAGAALDAECAALQAELLRSAFAAAGHGAAFGDVLEAMMTPQDRGAAATLDLSAERSKTDQAGNTGARLSKKAASPSR